MCLVTADTAVIFGMLIVTVSMSVAVFVEEVVIIWCTTGKHEEIGGVPLTQNGN